MRLNNIDMQPAVMTGVFAINMLRQFCHSRYCDVKYYVNNSHSICKLCI